MKSNRTLQSTLDSLSHARGRVEILLLACVCIVSFLWIRGERSIRASLFPYGAQAGFILSSDDLNASLLFPSDVSPGNVDRKLYQYDPEAVLGILGTILHVSQSTGVPIAMGICPRYAQVVQTENGQEGLIAPLEENRALCEMIQYGVANGFLVPYNHGMYHCFLWDLDGDGQAEPVSWHNPEKGCLVSVEDLVLAGEWIEAITGIRQIAFRSPGYHPYLNEDGYRGSPAEKTSLLLKREGYELDLNPHSFRYANVFPEHVGRIQRLRFLLADRTGLYWGRSGMRRYWGPFPFERDEEGILRLFTYPDVNVIPGAVERLEACYQEGYFCQESVPFTWMSNPDYLDTAISLMEKAAELRPNQAGGLWCPHRFQEILDWYSCSREGRYKISARKKRREWRIMVEVDRPCSLFTITVPISHQWKEYPNIQGFPAEDILKTEMYHGSLYLTSSIQSRFEWIIGGPVGPTGSLKGRSIS